VSSLPDPLSLSPLPTRTSTWLDANRQAMASAINSGVYRRAIATPVGPVNRPALPSHLGGGGGSRTRVRGHVGKSIYVRSLRMLFCPSLPPQAGSRSG
jgi:hypothetical protein